MAAPTVRQIRAGAGTRLATISGLRAHDTIPGQFSPPCGIVGMPSRPPTETFQRGTDRWDLTFWVVVARQADRQSEQKVEQYLNPTGDYSVRAAMYGDKTLGGVVSDLFELSAETVEMEFNGVTYLGLEFNYLIIASGQA